MAQPEIFSVHRPTIPREGGSKPASQEELDGVSTESGAPTKKNPWLQLVPPLEISSAPSPDGEASAETYGFVPHMVGEVAYGVVPATVTTEAPAEVSHSVRAVTAPESAANMAARRSPTGEAPGTTVPQTAYERNVQTGREVEEALFAAVAKAKERAIDFFVNTYAPASYAAVGAVVNGARRAKEIAVHAKEAAATRVGQARESLHTQRLVAQERIKTLVAQGTEAIGQAKAAAEQRKAARQQARLDRRERLTADWQASKKAAAELKAERQATQQNMAAQEQTAETASRRAEAAKTLLAKRQHAAAQAELYAKDRQTFLEAGKQQMQEALGEARQALGGGVSDAEIMQLAALYSAGLEASVPSGVDGTVLTSVIRHAASLADLRGRAEQANQAYRDVSNRAEQMQHALDGYETSATTAMTGAHQANRRLMDLNEQLPGVGKEFLRTGVRYGLGVVAVGTVRRGLASASDALTGRTMTA